MTDQRSLLKSCRCRSAAPTQGARRRWVLGRPLCRYVLAIVAVVATCLVGAPRSTAADGGPPVALEHFVAVTDVAWRPREEGCGAITVADSAVAAVLTRGEYDWPKQRRPSRLAATTDGRLLLAKAWQGPWVLVSKWQASDQTWAEGWIEVTGSSWYGTAIAISPDDSTLLVAGLDTVLKYDVANVTLDTLGPQTGLATITGVRQNRYHETAAGAIVFTADGRLAYVLTNDGLVYRLDVASMTWQGEPLAYTLTHRQRDYRLTRTFATLSPDERTLVINTGDEEGGRGQLTLLDTRLWQVQVIDTRELKKTWGVAFNYVGTNRGLLAVHGGTEVGVYSLRDDTAVPLAVARVPVTSDDYQDDANPRNRSVARFGALAWSGDGSRLVLNRGPYSGDGGRKWAEWRILELITDGAPELRRVADFDSCVSVDEVVEGLEASYGQDVVTLQKRPTLTTTPTPTDTPTVTLTPTVTPTPTSTGTQLPPSPTPTASPSSTAPPTATTVPSPVYLPLALRERCDSELKRADIVLVLDTSSSMTGQKIADAKAAALLFVGMIDLAPDRSQVALVRYDREAEVVRELTRAQALIEAAIQSLHIRSGTHIDKGLRAALRELQSPRHLERNSSVMILLTDGLQTGTPGEELRAAAEVREAGVRLYTIGLGSDVDETALKTMAGDDDRYYHAPDSADLASIYSEIAQDLMCPGKELWGGR